MRSLNLDQVRSLVAIADLGSFAAAAQALHLAPPTVSLHISELESRLGLSLMQRGQRGGVQFSTAGELMVARGRSMLRDAADMVAHMQHLAQGLAGKLRLATTTGVLVYLLPQVMAALAQQCPGLELEVSILGSHDTLAQLTAGKLDFGLVSLPLPIGPGLQCSAWRSDPMVAYLPSPWEAPAEVTPTWLADKALIFNESGTQMYRQTMSWFAQAGHHPTARIELNYTEAMKSMVAAGYGAAILPLEQDNEPHVLALHERLQLRPLQPPLTRELALVHREPAALPPAALPVLALLQGFARA